MPRKTQTGRALHSSLKPDPRKTVKLQIDLDFPSSTQGWTKMQSFRQTAIWISDRYAPSQRSFAHSQRIQKIVKHENMRWKVFGRKSDISTFPLWRLSFLALSPAPNYGKQEWTQKKNLWSYLVVYTRLTDVTLGWCAFSVWRLSQRRSSWLWVTSSKKRFDASAFAMVMLERKRGRKRQMSLTSQYKLWIVVFEPSI